MNQDDQPTYTLQTPAQADAQQTIPTTPDNLTAIAAQPSVRGKSRLPIIVAIITALVLISGLIGGFLWWQSIEQKSQDQQNVASVVSEFFEASRLDQTERLDQIIAADADEKFIESYHKIAKQIGRECKAEPTDVSVLSSKPTTAIMTTSCIPKQSWEFELTKDSDLSWKITAVEGTNLVPDIKQALAIDPYVNISIYEDENKPKPGSCLVPDDAALFNGTSLPRDPFLYFYHENILFETDSLKYFPTEKATDQFDALERFYRLTAQRRYHFIITPESYASPYKEPILKLANDRAEAVQESLLKRGIPRARITIENPVDETRTAPEQSRGVKVNIQASRSCEP
ncbi:hypothetical protein EOL73_00665 [Candidatus Saccharibacteria bacterium]|nr:hypothetical protein [Candidatus Saccharibacteria bacterium]NCU40255.1 hypothetical protein [Candidatus Saccharibacteria bacterium]